MSFENQNVETSPQEMENKLLIELYSLEQEIESINQEISKKDRKVNKIEKSSTWSLAKVLKTFKLNPKRRNVDIKKLENQVETLQKSVDSIKTTLNLLQIDDRKLNTFQMLKVSSEEFYKGNLLPFAEQLIRQKKNHDSNYKQTFQHIGRLLQNNDPQYKSIIYPEIYSVLRSEDVPEFMVRSGLSEEDISLSQVASFRSSLTLRMRQQQLTKSLPEWPLDQKKIAFQFVDQLNIRRPQFDQYVYDLNSFSLRDGVVIKPVDGAGSRGVYLLHKSDYIVDIKHNQRLYDIEQLRKRMQKDLENGLVELNEWQIEELVYEDREHFVPGRDIKFYCFYGRVALILEIKRHPEYQYCWWTRDGEMIETGKYNHQLFKGNGVSIDDIEMVEKASLNIPSPFMRIDFLRGDDELIFGEFTPKPGNYDEFNDNVDTWLGNEFIAAENRLVNDLIDGKTFSNYKKCMEDHGI